MNTEGGSPGNTWADRLKPAASRRTHLLLAASLWTIVGSCLFVFGSRWVVRGELQHAYLLLAAAALAGTVKARLIFVRTTRRVIERIRVRGDGRCLGGFISIPTWLLVGGMVAMGRVLRGGLLPKPAVGLIYAAVGVALLVGSQSFWRAWSRMGRPD